MRTCGQCALRQKCICPIFNMAVEANEPGCPSFTPEILTCELCGGVIVGKNGLLDVTNPERSHLICRNCKQTLGHCQSCYRAKLCDFETNPSTVPKVVQKEFRQGNMVQIMTVKNPSRIEITCKKGCPCFDPEIGCLRERNTCGNYKVSYEP